MPERVLTDAEVSTITNALRTAAHLYEEDAAVVSALAPQFKRQAKEARVLAERLEAADVVTLSEVANG